MPRSLNILLAWEYHDILDVVEHTSFIKRKWMETATRQGFAVSEAEVVAAVPPR